jgi:hypothetical protein
VEQYFIAQRVLPNWYWMGISRADLGRPYVYIDGSPVVQSPSNRPYAHWTWFTASYSQNPTYNCALVWSDLAYDDYLGKPNDVDQASRWAGACMRSYGASWRLAI